MFRIRRVHDDVQRDDAQAIAAVQAILRDQFPGLDADKIAEVPSLLRDPLAAEFRAILFVAERRGVVLGFALLLHDPALEFVYLDFIASRKSGTGAGIGGALYERARDEAVALHARGIFFEALPDDPALCRDAATVRQNAARLRFYERYGARPIVGTAYETPVRPEDDCAPYLVFDDLGSGRPLARAHARRIVRAILERRYARTCPPDYVDGVVASIRDEPVRLREPRYTRTEPSQLAVSVGPPGDVPGRRIALVVTDRHTIHHVRERGYVEAPVRIGAIEKALDGMPIFERFEPREFPESHITEVHDPDYVAYLRRVCLALPEGQSVYPYVFPIRNATRPPKDLAIRAGYYCIDTFTPLSRNAFLAARRAVDCSLTAAQKLLEAWPLAYALVRPPGHHAERRAFGGFCYFGTAAIAAQYLTQAGRVAILDVDYHHGNSQQNIFWRRGDVLTVSLHGDPAFAYPYFTGFADETGEDGGAGCNINYPLPEKLDGAGYLKALRKALRDVVAFEPDYLVIALGLDPARGDPTGSWTLDGDDFAANGAAIGALGLPTLVVQEGGYRTRTIGRNARRFFEGLYAGRYQEAAAPSRGPAPRQR